MCQFDFVWTLADLHMSALLDDDFLWQPKALVWTVHPAVARIRELGAAWRDKVAAGFTNSGSKSGDKVNTLISLAIFAAQHHMHWVSLGLGPGWNSSAGSAQTSTASASGWVPARKPMSTPTPTKFISPMCRRVVISGDGSCW